MTQPRALSHQQVIVTHPTQQELYDRALAAIKALKPDGIGCRNDLANDHWGELEFYLAVFPPIKSATPGALPVQHSVTTMQGLRDELALAQEQIDALQASRKELVRALAGIAKYFGVGSQGCACGRNDCPIRMAKVALTNAAKLAPTRAGGSGYER